MEKEKLIKDIEFGINATDGKDDYSVGMRNGMRWCLSLIDGKSRNMISAKIVRVIGGIISTKGLTR